MTALLGISAAGCAETDATPPLKPGPGGGGVYDPGGPGDPGDGSDPGGDPIPGGGLGCGEMDIIFVIDNSGSMRDEQQSLAASFPRMIEVLNTFRGGSLDYRVAVTTTAFPFDFLGLPISNGEQGAFLKVGSMPRPWLERGDGDLAATFTELATVGTQGSGQEQPLRAALAAIRERESDGQNQGFRRPDALLALVLLTDEDDQSGEPTGIPFIYLDTPVTQFVSDFDAVTGARARWATTVIAGDRACQGGLGSANEATRLLEFVDLAGANATFSSICQVDLSKPLEDALNTFKLACDDFVVY